MAKEKIKSDDGKLVVSLFNDGLVEIESELYKGLGIELRLIDPTNEEGLIAPNGALYVLRTYVPTDEGKIIPSSHQRNVYIGN